MFYDRLQIVDLEFFVEINYLIIKYLLFLYIIK
jgi:hypothetical protein